MGEKKSREEPSRRVAYGATLPAFEVSGMKETASFSSLLDSCPSPRGSSSPSLASSSSSFSSPFFPSSFELESFTHETSYNPSFQVARLVFRTLETTTATAGKTLAKHRSNQLAAEKFWTKFDVGWILFFFSFFFRSAVISHSYRIVTTNREIYIYFRPFLFYSPLEKLEGPISRSDSLPWNGAETE